MSEKQKLSAIYHKKKIPELHLSANVRLSDEGRVAGIIIGIVPDPAELTAILSFTMQNTPGRSRGNLTLQLSVTIRAAASSPYRVLEYCVAW